jgi:hypothetical protein
MTESQQPEKNTERANQAKKQDDCGELPSYPPDSEIFTAESTRNQYAAEIELAQRRRRARWGRR